MLKHCVLTVDYSGDWARTLDYLPGLLALLQCEQLTLVHVVEVFKRKSGEDAPEVIEENLKDIAGRICDQLQIAVDWEVRSGFAASQIVDVAKLRQVDGIIALNRSHSSAREFFMGNIVLNLARLSHVPLVVVSSDGVVAAESAPVMLATDGSAATRVARDWFERFVKAGRDGVAVWVDSDRHDDEAEAHRTLAVLTSTYSGVTCRHLQGNAVNKLVETADELNVALLVIARRGTTPIENLPLGRTAEGVVRKCRQPVLLLPA
ncbi:universal stress protein [Haliea sp. E1-2-M8]|uniref:universal stress protein n=1 Tax=Haliea sp. E1-2-M8 TaxID=3064706 RepID=UPI0027198639|nr:universal stress protein [Haliea sp. E1-2-M8]MDO8861074.1 universal stress protein [Haliea sp. E1-2-M8]